MCLTAFRHQKNQLGVTFHFFPKEINLREKWRITVSRQRVKKGSLRSPTDSSQICSLHFLDTNFSASTKNRRILPNKVPSVFGCFPSHRQKTLTNNNDFPKRLHGKPLNRKILKI
ncbi:hypothetical protein C0J52_01918 [Blattella germanica]|nr:hypothetical protein C0J52_01918 [Blattella germanica]